METSLSLGITVRLIDFLVHLLEAQAQTLQRLAAFFGEAELLEMLETAGEIEDAHPTIIKINPHWFEKSNQPDRTSTYAKLEGSVHDFKLSAMLEFHLWAYPFYRTIVESPLDLKFKIRDTDDQSAIELINESVHQAELWIKRLAIPASVSPAAERAASVPWLRFRSEVLKKIGMRPFRIS
jgi:hypothetical protein